MPRILFVDIESSDLKADFGNMIAFGYKYQGEPGHVISLLDVNKHCRTCKRVDAVDDKALVEQAHAILVAADVIVTWYGKGFDSKFLNTRVLDAGLPPLPNTPHVDLYFTAKHHLLLSSNRLANVQDFLGLKTSKTPLTKRVWRQAQAGHVPSIEYVVTHCLKDVEVLEEAYDRLKPYVRSHPRMSGVAGPGVPGCRVCGAAVQRRGQVATILKGPRQRVQCTKCGHWEDRPMKEAQV